MPYVWREVGFWDTITGVHTLLANGQARMSSSGTRSAADAGTPGSPPPLDLTGRTFDDFRILRKLGQGGMGQVYLAEQISLKRKVALKILRPDHAASGPALIRFEEEAKNVARATHANIVQVYAFGTADGMPYMALEYVEGRNLKEFVTKKGPPDLMVALSIMRQVAAALQRASELGIVHRDIKPENILLTRKGEVKVADFGLSRCLEGDSPALNLTQTGVAMGTPLYMSPEQVEGKPIDFRTDIYSFGVSCYYLLTGQPPFTGATAFEVAVQHVQKPPPPLSDLRPDLPEGVCQIVHKMLAKDPAQRYQTGRELLRDIVRAREGMSGISAAEPVEATPPTGRPRLLPLAVGGSLLLALAAGAAVAWRERLREGPLPGTGDVRPADASVVKTILGADKREQALRLLVDEALNTAAGQAPDPTAFTNCMELGLFYLDNDRLADADKLFARLEGLEQPASFKMLGQLGRGIVLALRSKPEESNRLFCKVFGVNDSKKGKAGGGWQRQVEGRVAPVKPFLDHPRGMHWMAKARWYNERNGLPRGDEPRYLPYRYPLERDAKK